MKRIRKSVFFALFAFIAAVMLCGCDGGLESKLVGSWGWSESSPKIAFTLYSDGTAKISNSYGTGRWNVVNDNTLKLTDFYGQTETIEIQDSNGNIIQFSNGSKMFKKEPAE